MSNHCLDVICKTCGVVYCIRCHRITSLPDINNIKDKIFLTRVTENYCKYCRKETLYIN